MKRTYDMEGEIKVNTSNSEKSIVKLQIFLPRIGKDEYIVDENEIYNISNKPTQGGIRGIVFVLRRKSGDDSFLSAEPEIIFNKEFELSCLKKHKESRGFEDFYKWERARIILVHDESFSTTDLACLKRELNSGGYNPDSRPSRGCYPLHMLDPEEHDKLPEKSGESILVGI